MSTFTGSHNCICVRSSSDELAAWDLNLVCSEASLSITTDSSTVLESEIQFSISNNMHRFIFEKQSFM